MGAHPYSPVDLDLAGYVPTSLSQVEIMGIFVGASLFILAAVWLLSGSCSRLTKTDRLLMSWMVYAGIVHLLVEGYLVVTPGFYTKQNPNLIGDLWKVVSRGDSRYIARDTTTTAVLASMALLVGPAYMLAVYAIASRKSYSHILQFTVCLGELYAYIVHFATAYLDGSEFWASQFDFWAYFICPNIPWIVIVLLITVRSWKKICGAIHQVEKVKTK